MHHAAIAGTRRVIEVLLYFGAEINIQSSDGDYPLDLAVREGNYDIAQFLIENGGLLRQCREWNATKTAKTIQQEQIKQSHKLGLMDMTTISLRNSIIYLE